MSSSLSTDIQSEGRAEPTQQLQDICGETRRGEGQSRGADQGLTLCPSAGRAARAPGCSADS